APESLIYIWQAEVRKFAPSLSIQVINGIKIQREELLAKDTDIRVTTYASLRHDLANYLSLKIDYLILDEAQMVINS
ncbi:SNF2-related protein, partial [Enterococcus faecium]|uniref:SNF2-related protein n=1 Tax=Enterococcus faecium TaxID=1352 RepID=UPI003CC5882C